MDKLSKLREERDRMNNEIQIAEREGDYEKAGRLKYSELPALEKQLAQEEDKVGESDLSLVHEKYRRKRSQGSFPAGPAFR